MTTDLPAAIAPDVAMRPRRLDVFVERINAALGEPWTAEDRLKGRPVGVKHADKADVEAIAKHFRAAGWNVGGDHATLLFHPSK
jgi:hypothetical protein